MTMKYYKIVDVFGNLKTVYRPQEMMQPYIDMGLAMERLPEAYGWRSCYKGSRDFFRKGNPIAFEPHEWDTDKMIEAYAPLLLAYKKISSGKILPPDSYRQVA